MQLRAKRPRQEDPGASFMESNRGQDRMDLRSSRAPTSSNRPLSLTAPQSQQPRTGENTASTSSNQPVSMTATGSQQPRPGSTTGGKGTRNRRSVPRTLAAVRHQEIPPEESSGEEGEPTSVALQCPFQECPDSLITKSKRALVSHWPPGTCRMGKRCRRQFSRPST